MYSRDGIYNRAVWWPDFIRLPHMLTLDVNHTLHVLERAEERAPSLQHVPDTIHAADNEIIQVEIINDKIVSILVRQYFKNGYDAVYGVDLRNMNLCTMWLNHKSDQHDTLDKTRYVKRPN